MFYLSCKEEKPFHSNFFIEWEYYWGKEANYMYVKGLAIAMGVGAAVGAVAILAMPKNNPTRRLAAKAADKVEDVAWRVSNKICDELDM